MPTKLRTLPLLALVVLALLGASPVDPHGVRGRLTGLASDLSHRAGLPWGGGASAGSVDLAGLTPAMSQRVRGAVSAADAAGVPLEVTSAWRSAEHQQRLLDEAVQEHGSLQAAYAWVLPPEESAHVRGEAVDVGPAAGRQWLEENGAELGLCRRYANEPWRFEPLVEPGRRCPALETDAASTLLAAAPVGLGAPGRSGALPRG